MLVSSLHPCFETMSFLSLLPAGAGQVSEMPAYVGNVFPHIAKFTSLKAYYVPGAVPGGTGGVTADSQQLPLALRIPTEPQGPRPRWPNAWSHPHPKQEAGEL